jgi:glycosyltransferase involved in cell wall biosynthesis
VKSAIDISVITPSLNMLEYLKRCCASVVDQQGTSHEHIIIDGRSVDGTPEWLKAGPISRYVVEPDNGMYDALNKGLRMAHGEIVSYLNCDEQYLPGTLQFVKEFFAQNPEVDILFGDFLIVRPDGTLLSYRKASPPRWYYFSSAHLYLFTCTMFLRRRIIDDGFLFNGSYRAVADEEFVVQLLRHGYGAMHVERYLAAFTMTGKNRSRTYAALEERHHMRRTVPLWVKLLKYPLNVARYGEKLVHGAYTQAFPLGYALYVGDARGNRQEFLVRTASWRWPRGY